MAYGIKTYTIVDIGAYTDEKLAEDNLVFESLEKISDRIIISIQYASGQNRNANINIDQAHKIINILNEFIQDDRSKSR